ncbi:oligopeptide ABC transporter permease [Lacticaseibacillus brantae]|uniref:Nickel ABC transporter, permease subunit NikB n=1 Tax=Lacticaseibacillus brantae DSM 23927 TaxID=1423727 RepID=A0A0R2B153_9LACO|nr:oligopeptide ABC transporter permease [Lacticaseibacillus brantae]KRM72794.1 nickel ABC transporter, permease subunit NikB [Lacticaseibacillus brantae DSM 23927]
MWKTILRRILIMIPQILLLSVIVFFLAKLMPGDPFSGQITPQMDPKQIDSLRRQLGLDDPLWTQYFRWIGNLFHGDLGMSYAYKRPVISLIAERASNTIWLSLFAVILTYLIGVPLGVLAGRFKGTRLDSGISLYAYSVMAIPSFVFYLIALLIFGYQLKWFPTTGSVALDASGGVGYIMSRLYHMVLPAILQAFLGTTGIILYLRSGIIDNSIEDYVRTARAKGVPEKVIFNKHILRNSLLPIAAFMGNTITGLISGSLFVESVFSYPGMGKLAVDAMTTRDYATMTSLTLLFGFLTLLGNLLSDIIMSIVDPRIRVE